MEVCECVDLTLPFPAAMDKRFLAHFSGWKQLWQPTLKQINGKKEFLF